MVFLSGSYKIKSKVLFNHPTSIFKIKLIVAYLFFDRYQASV
jgi:hypothetical protein